MHICKDSSPIRTSLEVSKNMVMSCFQRMRLDCRIESFYTQGTPKKIDCFNADVFCAHCHTVFETMGCFYHCWSYQDVRRAPTEKTIQRGSKKRDLEEMRRQYIEEKGYTVVKMWECEWWNLHTTDVPKKNTRESRSHTRVHCVSTDYCTRQIEAHCLLA